LQHHETKGPAGQLVPLAVEETLLQQIVEELDENILLLVLRVYG